MSFIADAERRARLGGPKTLDTWIEIAWGLHWLHEELLDQTEIEDESSTNFMRDRADRAAMDGAENECPALLKYMRSARRRQALFWLEEKSSDIQRWAWAHPELDRALADTTPESIKALYLRVNGGEEWHPTDEQLALISAKEAALEAGEKQILGDVNERIRIARDVVSDKPRSR